ncbi:hypothetical protein H9Q74_009960 [Fusarium xylarioides]|nr:hypothetical protein H9Q71_001694 [Fusarium xylarioides]KAG5818635.1 hypothetical protein H9Q74_009960 [Fusarium xylarioides]
MGVDDLLLGLTHHWSRDTSVFPTEDDRLDLPTIILSQAYSACRPAELVDGTKSRGHQDPLLEGPDEFLQVIKDESDDEDNESVFDDDQGFESDATGDTELDKEGSTSVKDPNREAGVRSQPLPLPEDRGTETVRKHKALCYEDLTLWIVKDPTMEVYLRFHKGSDNKPKPTVFLFREHPLPILCPISHILARALRDDAIQVDGYSSAEPFFSTQLGKDAVKVHWKLSKLKSPVFRRSVRTDHGGWEKSPTEPMKYATYAFYLDRIGRDLGSEEKWTSYAIRREYKFIRLAPKTVRREYAQMRRDLINAEKRFRDEMTTVYQEACRRRFHDDELERQLRGEHVEKEAEPMLIHHLPERTYLQKILCDFNTSLSIKDITERKVKAIDGMVALACRREIRGPILKKDEENLTIIPALEDKDPGPPTAEVLNPFPLILEKTQCIYCVGDEKLSHADRTRKFSRVSHMMDQWRWLNG